ncbi:hypothetical protein [Parabacteroides sp. ZJ-118]|uniref:hypothetical protein n=1 Tax=Parabacteroides sp. ZJ-118 TaxID=2709398 RepID=UPI00197CBF1F|nr:hypothetical protein [Parabacteroides sp. ZJ-118]
MILSTKRLLESFENFHKAGMELNKQIKHLHSSLKGYQPEENLVKLEKITYIGSTKDFVRLIMPILNDHRFRVNGRPNREAMVRALEEVFEIRPDGCSEPRRFRSILSAVQEEFGKMRE